MTVIDARTQMPERATSPTLEAELRQLMRALSKPQILSGLSLAARLAPRLRERYPDLTAAADQAVLAHGLARLWRDMAGALPLTPANREQLERFFALMVRDLYPAQYGIHRFLISSDDRIGPVQTFDDPAYRLGHPEYLALIYADGDLDRARAVLRQSGEMLRALAETTLDGLAAPPNAFTVYSRWRAAVRLLTPQVAQLLGEASQPDTPAALGQPTFDFEAVAEPTAQAASLAEQFADSLAEGQDLNAAAAVIEATLEKLGTPRHRELGRTVARRLAAIQLGLAPTADQTPSLTPANVRATVRLAHDQPLGTEVDMKVLWDLQEAGLLDQKGDVWRFTSQDLAEWFAAEYIATYSERRYLPQPRYRRLQLWAAELLAQRQDDMRNWLLTVDMTNAWSSLHPVAWLDMAEVLAVFDGRETPSITAFRQNLAPALQELADISCALLQMALQPLAAYFDIRLTVTEGEQASLARVETLEQARASVDAGQLAEALGLPAALLDEPRWFDQRRALAALLSQIEAPRPAGLAEACAAWLSEADLNKLLEVQLSWRWPILQPVTALDRLLQIARDPQGEARSRELALTILARDSHLKRVLTRDTPDALAAGTLLLLLTGQRANWNPRRGRYELLV